MWVSEKPEGDGGWINGGFFILDQVIDRIADDNTVWEQEPLKGLAEKKSHYHNGFWQPMDTLRDRRELEAL